MFYKLLNNKQLPRIWPYQKFHFPECCKSKQLKFVNDRTKGKQIF